VTTQLGRGALHLGDLEGLVRRGIELDRVNVRLEQERQSNPIVVRREAPRQIEHVRAGKLSRLRPITRKRDPVPAGVHDFNLLPNTCGAEQFAGRRLREPAHALEYQLHGRGVGKVAKIELDRFVPRLLDIRREHGEDRVVLGDGITHVLAGLDAGRRHRLAHRGADCMNHIFEWLIHPALRDLLSYDGPANGHVNRIERELVKVVGLEPLFYEPQF